MKCMDCEADALPDHARCEKHHAEATAPRTKAAAFCEQHAATPILELPRLACLAWFDALTVAAPPLRSPKLRAEIVKHLESFWSKP